MSDTIYYCLVNRNYETQLRAAPQHHRHGVVFTSTVYAHTELDENYTIILRVVASCANILAAKILQAVCCQFCHTDTALF